jgi:hypothetical protein
VTIRSLVGLVDLGGAFARQQHRQGLVDELGIGGASAHPSGVIEQAAIHGGSPHVAGAPQMSACRSATGRFLATDAGRVGAPRDISYGDPI